MRTERHTVTDFVFSIDATNYVAPTWERIVATPNKDLKEPELGEWRAVMEEFTRSRNLLKEIHLQKQILWDFNNLRTSIYTSIRAMGYMHDLSITFPQSNCKISALSASTMSRAADNTCVKIFCVVTCLCIIFYPIFLLSRKNVNNQLFAYYLCVAPAQEFYNRNIGTIMGAVACRAHGSTYLAL
ncbi:hypothetical protein BC830DRAFT_337466 [Chytriomyces sp. MP71]|nr:hypothetical protein BC830DRAFT_337466 [Chytriomyces sp. MP71]